MDPRVLFQKLLHSDPCPSAAVPFEPKAGKLQWLCTLAPVSGNMNSKNGLESIQMSGFRTSQFCGYECLKHWAEFEGRVRIGWADHAELKLATVNLIGKNLPCARIPHNPNRNCPTTKGFWLQCRKILSVWFWAGTKFWRSCHIWYERLVEESRSSWSQKQRREWQLQLILLQNDRPFSTRKSWLQEQGLTKMTVLIDSLTFRSFDGLYCSLSCSPAVYRNYPCGSRQKACHNICLPFPVRKGPMHGEFQQSAP